MEESIPAGLLELAEGVVATLTCQGDQLTQTQSHVVHLQEQLSQAEVQRDAAQAELTQCKEQLRVVAHTAHTAQTSLQQVIT